MDPMMGMIYMLPFNWAPRGYSLCQGQTLQLSQYQALFSLMGNTYGGDAQTTFMLPDLRGRVPLGYGVSPSLGNFPVGTAAGVASQTLTQAQMPVHSHVATFTGREEEKTVTSQAVPSTLNVAVDVDVYGAAGESSTASSTYTMLAGISNTNTKMYASPKTTNLVKLSNVNTTVTGNAGSPSNNFKVKTLTGGDVTLNTAGLSQPVSMMQPYLALNFVIAMDGIYPSRQ